MFDTLLACMVAYDRAHPDALARYGVPKTPEEVMEETYQFAVWSLTTPLELSRDAAASERGEGPGPQCYPSRAGTLLGRKARGHGPTSIRGARVAWPPTYQRVGTGVCRKHLFAVQWLGRLNGRRLRSFEPQHSHTLDKGGGEPHLLMLLA